MSLPPIPESFATSRDEMQRLAVHVLARRRYARCGKLGLRATPGGFGAPAAGPDHEIVRVSGTNLIRETTGGAAATSTLDLTTATLERAAALVDADLDATFDAGRDTPPIGDPLAPLEVDPVAVAVLAEWYRFAWHVLDVMLAMGGPASEPSVIQLWPEHFDAAFDLAATAGRRVNLGASPGDGIVEQPYVYVGPWGDDRPGDAMYWNAPFGAVLPYDELRAADDPVAAAVDFLRRGVELLRG